MASPDTPSEPTERTRLQRNPKRAVYDRETIHAILDEAMLCHLAVSMDGAPCIIPTIHTRIGDALYLHGSTHNRLFRHLATGAEACLSVTLLDGLVLARSGLHHSMNYRSVILYARGTVIDDLAEKNRVLEALVEGLIPGRWADSRQPTDSERRATAVLRFPITEASAKVRQGPPIDDDRDRDLPIWAGILPTRLSVGEPIQDQAGQIVPLPAYLRDYDRLPRT